MFGPGIYFATDPDKSRHFALGNQLLLCRVALGRPLVLPGADESLNRAALFSRGYDSVCAPSGSKATRGMALSEYERCCLSATDKSSF